MAIYKEIESGSGLFEKKLVLLPQTVLSNSQLKFTKAQRTDLTDRMFANLFASFNLPITLEQQQMFTGGVYQHTAFQYLNANDVIIVEIPKNSYGEMIDGKSISLTVPTNAGSVQIYSSFFKNSLLNTAGHMVYSDPNGQSKAFGQAYNISELPGQAGLTNPLNGYSSNIAFLFSDSIQRPEKNNTYTWSVGGKYFKGQTGLPTGVSGNKNAANYSSGDGTVDIPVGIAYLDKGFIVITHPTIVNDFKHTAAFLNGSGYTGTNKFSNIYFPTIANLAFSSFNTEFVQHAVCIALPNEFYKSNNPTFVQAYGENVEENPVAVTEIGLYNDKYELIAIAKTNKPLPKGKSSVLSFDIVIKV